MTVRGTLHGCGRWNLGAGSAGTPKHLLRKHLASLMSDASMGFLRLSNCYACLSSSEPFYFNHEHCI